MNRRNFLKAIGVGAAVGAGVVNATASTNNVAKLPDLSGQRFMEHKTDGVVDKVVQVQSNFHIALFSDDACKQELSEYSYVRQPAFFNIDEEGVRNSREIKFPNYTGKGTQKIASLGVINNEGHAILNIPLDAPIWLSEDAGITFEIGAINIAMDNYDNGYERVTVPFKELK